MSAHVGRPRCFPDERTWREWRGLARDSREPRITPCTDCTPAYEYRMREEGKCERVAVMQTHKFNVPVKGAKHGV